MPIERRPAHLDEHGRRRPDVDPLVQEVVQRWAQRRVDQVLAERGIVQP